MDYKRYFQKLTVFMQFARSMTMLSSCKRHGVGVVVCPTDFSQVFSVGFNGPPIGLPNDSCTNEVGNCGCSHAEINALVKPSQLMWPSLMLSTVKPCFNCANATINSSAIVAVVYLDDCRHTGPEDKLRAAGIDCISYMEVRERHDLLSKWWSLGAKCQRATLVQRYHGSVPGR